MCTRAAASIFWASALSHSIYFYFCLLDWPICPPWLWSSDLEFLESVTISNLSQSCSHSCGSSLNIPHFVNILLQLRTPKQDTGLYQWSHQCQIQRKNNISSPFKYPPDFTPKNGIRLFGHRSKLGAHVPVIFHHDPWVFFKDDFP